MKNGTRTLQTVTRTYQEWRDALKVPLPERNKKKYLRKQKHKNKPQ
jgi:hypothetical protein